MPGISRIGACVTAGLLCLPAAATARVEEAAVPSTVRAPQVLAADAPKIAVVGSPQDLVGTSFSVVDANDVVVLSGTLQPVAGSPAPWAHAATADFSSVDDPGSYRVVVGQVESGQVLVEADPYAEILGSLLGIFDANANADGREPSSLHGPSHLNDARSKIRNGPLEGRRIDVTGGWMDAGDQLKFTVTTGFAATMLQLAARNQPSSAGALHALADVGVRWLLKAHPNRKTFVSLVGDPASDHDVGGFRDPASDDASPVKLLRHRPTHVLTKGTKGADVAAAAATALALAAQRTSGNKRKRYVRAAEEWLDKARSLRGPWKNAFYSQDTVKDDLAAAAVELWRATGRSAHRDDALDWLRQVTGNGDRGWLVAMDGFEMAALPAAELCGVLGRPAPSNATIRRTACRILRAGGDDATYKSEQNAFGMAGPVIWGSVRGNQSGSLTALLAARHGHAGAEVTAHRALGWFLGANPWGIRFQAGYGVQHPHHWATDLGPGLPDGAIVGGPAPASDIDGEPFLPPIEYGPFDTEAAVYRDLVDDYVTNEVGINYNAGSVLLMALLSPG